MNLKITNGNILFFKEFTTRAGRFIDFIDSLSFLFMKISVLEKSIFFLNQCTALTSIA